MIILLLSTKIDDSNNLQEYLESDFDICKNGKLWYTTASSSDGYTLRYDVGTSTGNYSKGSGIADTRLNGSGNYQTRFVGEWLQSSRISKRYSNNKYLLFKINYEILWIYY